MGVKIVGEGGAVLHEFRDGLGVLLLHRLLIAAKFREDADYDIVLNEHVAALGKSLRTAVPARARPSDNDDDILRAHLLRLVETFNHQVSTGALKWPTWQLSQKQTYVRDVMCEPFRPSEQFVADFIEERDAALNAWRRVLRAD